MAVILRDCRLNLGSGFCSNQKQGLFVNYKRKKQKSLIVDMWNSVPCM